MAKAKQLCSWRGKNEERMLGDEMRRVFPKRKGVEIGLFSPYWVVLPGVRQGGCTRGLTALLELGIHL